MKKLLLCLSTFLLVFCCGMIFVFFHNSYKLSGHKASGLPEKNSGIKTAAAAFDVKKLQPLPLPQGTNAERGFDKSWEYTGEIKSNLVSARGRLVSSFCQQGWIPDKKISLDESLAPREILTFTQNKYELILMLWKISGNATGFAYRRGVQDESIKQVIQ